MAQNIPNNIEIAFANGEKIVGDNGQTYYDYFNTSIRWLCGYNNEFIGNNILTLSNQLKKDPNYFKKLYKEVSSVFINNTNKSLKNISFFDENTINILNREFTVDDKFSVGLTNNNDQYNFLIKDFLDLVSLEKEERKPKLTSEGWSKTKIKRFFKHYKNQISLFVVSPLLLKEGIILSQETVRLLYSCCKKYRIPFIWDESITCFYRTGTFLFLEQYDFKPDFISIDSNVYQEKKLHLLFINKHISRKIKKSLEVPIRKNQAINLILLKSFFDFFEEFNISKYVNKIGYRLDHKLKALSSNLRNRFEYEVTGIITLLRLHNNNYAKRLYNNLEENNLLFYFNENKTFIFIPPVILTTHSADLLIQFINNFFREGIKLQKHNTEI